MERKVRCQECGQLFVAHEDEGESLEIFGKAGDTELFIECTVCNTYTACNPSAIIAGVDDPVVKHSSAEVPLRCPIARCDGWVSYVEESSTSSFWGCGECGNVWRTRSALERAISKIIKRYPYRSGSYIRGDGGWEAASSKEEVPNYSELVEQEDPP